MTRCGRTGTLRSMLFRTVVETSLRVAATPRRGEKIELISKLLKQLRPPRTGSDSPRKGSDSDEVEIATAHLSGVTRQGKTGIGYAALREASAPPAHSPHSRRDGEHPDDEDPERGFALNHEIDVRS